MAFFAGLFALGNAFIIGKAIHDRREEREREEREERERQRREEERKIREKLEEQKRENERKEKEAREAEERRREEENRRRSERERIAREKLEQMKREQEIRKKKEEEERKKRLEEERKLKEEEERKRKEEERRMKEQEEQRRRFYEEQRRYQQEQEEMERRRRELNNRRYRIRKNDEDNYNNYISRYNTYTNDYNRRFTYNQNEINRWDDDYNNNQLYSRQIQEEYKYNLFSLNNDFCTRQKNIERKREETNNYYNRINEERRKKEEYKRKLKKEAIDKYETEKEHQKNKFLEQINIKQNISLNKEYINSNLIPYTKDKIMNIIDIANHLESMIRNYGNILIEQKVKQKLKYFNILVIGETGKGKSTLINSMLYLNPLIDGAKEGKVESITKGEPKPYISNKIQYLRLWDTEGYTYKNLNINKFYESISSFIQAQIEKEKPEDYIHAIWYCINGSRFEEKEKQFILKFQKAYPDIKLPIILVYTQAYKPSQVKKFKEGCESFLKENKIDFIDVIAKKYMHCEQKNLKTLFEMTKNKINVAINSATFHMIKSLTKNEIIRIYKNICEQINNNLNGEKKLIDINNYKEKLFDYMKLIYENYQILDKDFDYNPLFSNISKKIITFIDNEIQKNINNISDKLKNVLYTKYISIQSDINRQYKYSLDYNVIEKPFDLLITCKNEIVNFIKPKIKKELIKELTFNYLISYSNAIKNLFINSFEIIFENMKYFINQKICAEISAKTKEVYNEIKYRYN